MLIKETNRGISPTIVMLISAGVVIAGVSYWLLFTSSMDKQNTNKENTNQNEVMEHEDTIMEDSHSDDAMMEREGDIMEENGDAMMEHEDDAMMEDEIHQDDNQNTTTSPQAGVYIDYSDSALAMAQADGKKSVLFFWAAWCPYCKAANEDFNENLSKIPADVVLLKTNYDTEKALKTKYGITYQHTFVQIDASGNQITKWSGGGIGELLANVQ